MTDKQYKANCIVEDLIYLKDSLKRNDSLSYEDYRRFADILNKACNEIKELSEEGRTE